MSKMCFKIVQEWVPAGEWGDMVLTMAQSFRVLGDRYRRGHDMFFLCLCMSFSTPKNKERFKIYYLWLAKFLHFSPSGAAIPINPLPT